MPWLRVLVSLLRARFLVLFAFLGKLYLALAAYRSFRWMMKASVLTAFILWLPLPGWLVALPGRIAAMPAGMAFLLKLVEFRAGLGIVVGALIIRFISRLVLESMKD